MNCLYCHKRIWFWQKMVLAGTVKYEMNDWCAKEWSR